MRPLRLNKEDGCRYSSVCNQEASVEKIVKLPNASYATNIQRIQRNLIQRLVLGFRFILSTFVSLIIIITIVSIATFKRIRTYLLISFDISKSQEIYEMVTDELITADETYYVERYGYKSEKHKVITQDGYILVMYRIYKDGTKPKGRKPVLIGHGLFQCSGAFVLNEEKSLAFELVSEGYDVWVGNNRAIAGYDHVSLSYHDPEYWNWGLKELGIYDFTAMVDHVRVYSGYSKVAYIGHSQGNTLAFIGLSLCPEIANKLSCFVALAPAVFSGNLVKSYPLCLLIRLNDWLYPILFGTSAFLPMMSVAQSMIHPKVFCFLAYNTFSYLFEWWDTHWLCRRKIKYFQFTPRPVSAQLIADWVAGWGRSGVCLYMTNTKRHTVASKVPLTVIYGTADYLVNGDDFVRKFPGYENHGLSLEKQQDEKREDFFPTLDLVQVERIEGYEHMDTIWGDDNHKTTYPAILKQLKQANWSLK